MNHTSSLLKIHPATKHWLMQRITAILLILLSFQLLVFLNLCLHAPYEQTLAWLKAPVNMFYILGWLVLTFYHAALGLQVVIEDYVGNRSVQALLIKAINLSFAGLAILSLILIYKIS